MSLSAGLSPPPSILGAPGDLAVPGGIAFNPTPSVAAPPPSMGVRTLAAMQTTVVVVSPDDMPATQPGAQRGTKEPHARGPDMEL